MEEKNKVLFVCAHNSARSQMAEAYFNKFVKGDFLAESAGIEAGTLNPLVVEVMKEDGFDISGNQTKSVFDFFKAGRLYSHVVTVCDHKTAEQCPIFPGRTERLHWSFDDPSSLGGTDEEKLKKIRTIRDQIKEQIKLFIKEHIEPME